MDTAGTVGCLQPRLRMCWQRHGCGCWGAGCVGARIALRTAVAGALYGGAAGTVVALVMYGPPALSSPAYIPLGVILVLIGYVFGLVLGLLLGIGTAVFTAATVVAHQLWLPHVSSVALLLRLRVVTVMALFALAQAAWWLLLQPSLSANGTGAMTLLLVGGVLSALIAAPGWWAAVWILGDTP